MDAQNSTFAIGLEDVLQSAVDGLFVIDQNRELVYFSEGCERITGADRSGVVGTACVCFQLTDCVDEHGRSLAGVLCPSVKIFNGEIPNYRQRMSIRRADGTQVWVETNYSPVRGDDGQITAVAGVMRDITETKAREDELRGYQESTPEVEIANATETVEDLGRLDQVLTSLERREILAALKQSNGQRTLAAKALGISRSRLYRRMDALGIDPHEIR